MKLSDGTILSFKEEHIEINDDCIPIRTFTRNKMLFLLLDNISSIQDQAKILKTMLHVYVNAKKNVASKKHKGCRNATKHRDGLDGVYGTIRQLCKHIRVATLELEFKSKLKEELI